MNVQKLNIILEALKYGSMTKAAEKLGYTQSALTYAINSTEQELGFPVVIRDANGIRLSKEGEELFPCIQDIVECENRLMAKAKEIMRGRGNVLNIAVYPSTADVLLPEILETIVQEYGYDLDTARRLHQDAAIAQMGAKVAPGVVRRKGQDGRCQCLRGRTEL